MHLSKQLTTVTPVSKAIAMFLFIILPFLSFYLGEIYQQELDKFSALQGSQMFLSPTPSTCPTDIIVCSDGSRRSRSGPNCEFTPCPTPFTPSREFCKTNADCTVDEVCVAPGPLRVDTPEIKRCWPKNAPLPL